MTHFKKTSKTGQKLLILLAILFSLSLSACGNKGELYLPDAPADQKNGP